MHRRASVSLTVALAIAAPMTAHAGGKDDLLRSAGEALGVYYKLVRELTSTPTHADALPDGQQCETDVRAWQAKGVKPHDRIFSYDFNAHPSAKANTIELAEMTAVCADYQRLHGPYKADFDLKQYDGVLMRIRDGLIKPGSEFLTAHVIDEYERTGDPAGCKRAVVAARALDPKTKSNGISGRLSLDDYQTKVCDELAKVHPTWVADARAALRANIEKKMAPYAAAGVGGKKLELMVQYDGVYWRLPGGDRTDDPKTLAHASVLFHWLEAEDRADPRYVIHTIRKFKFKGNALQGVTEKQYRKKKGADLGDVFR